ncbi:unnamed protein product [Phaedon cochleariae]|uniref:Uncharacterized protein n=1 Tax=Phaedon cochleariae TaxID=80249 RepID=A0A9N9SN46_PHACE|nr:unnamed protein product [Phaedon cochleariae]
MASSGDDGSDVSDSEVPVTPKKKSKFQQNYKKRTQRFRSEWESTFKWVKADQKSKTKAYCKECNTTLASELYILKYHDACKRHKANPEAKRSNTTVLTNFTPTIRNNNVAVAEIKIAGFFAEHNLSFSVVDHLIPLLKEIAPDSAVINDMQIGRTKLTALVKNVVGLH